jgi:pyruvate/2-oxoglutarate dehydrogenase complex dihydrolipoamide acyltransferase (E2) component
MDKCITCGTELHPERARKYNYCMSPECQRKNAKGLTMVAVGVNKSAEQYLILDEQTKEDLASGKYHDQRRGTFGVPLSSPPRQPQASAPAPAQASAPAPAARRERRAEPQRPGVTRQPWSRSQQRLALLYNEQGLNPDEIAQKLGLSRYLVTQIILNSRSRGKL